MSWISLLILGGAGGMLNALVSRPVRWLPSVKRIEPRRASVLGLGVAGNVLVGAAATIATGWLPIVRACADYTTTEIGLVLASGVHLGIGFVTARWLTVERDRAVLRRAVYKAVTAPAAHPDTARAIERASAEAIYDAVEELLPRRNGDDGLRQPRY